MNIPSIETTRKRTERYWYEDGIWEIGFGLINLLLAGHFALTRWILANDLSAPLLVISLVAVFLGIFWGMAYVMRFLKERITYPRTGYVAYRRGPLKERARRILLIGLLSASVGAILSLVSNTETISSFTPIVSGVMMSGAVLYIGYRFGLLRMYVLAGLTITLAVAVAFLPITEDMGRVLFFGMYGLLFLLSGSLILANYLRRTRPQGEGQPDYEAPASLEED